MSGQADNGSFPGGEPGEGASLPGLFAAFEKGGTWDVAAPSAALAKALQAAAGPDGLYNGAEAGSLVGIARQWAAIESWAAAGLMSAMRAMMREDGSGRPLLRRDLALPDGWDDSLNYEIAAALAMGPVSAGHLANLAWALGMRLPGIGRLLVEGILTRSKAKLVVQIFGPLDEDEAARAEALIVGELAGKTYFQVERLAWRAALAVAPDVAERRRAKAEKQARVAMFREEAGTVGLSGRDLPASQALSGHANVLARADLYAGSSAFPGEPLGRLQALAYLDLLNGVSAADRIAFARAGTGEPPSAPAPGPAPGDPDGENPPWAGSGSVDPGPDDPGPDDPGPDDPGPDDPGPDDSGPASGSGGPHTAEPEPGDALGPVGAEPDLPGPHAAEPGPPARLVEVTVPLATLLGQGKRAGENRLLGPLDPALTRDLAAAAARSAYSRWEIVIVDDEGYAVGYGIARSKRRPQGPAPPALSAAAALPARVSITITETYLRQLAAQAPACSAPRSGTPPGGWRLAPGPAITTQPEGRSPEEYGTWTLTLPGGRELGVRFDVVPTWACDHRYQVGTYQPSARLRRLVQIRDRECTFPTCSHPAHGSDFEHAVPYDQGGVTDACNAGARSRRCHQVKQAPGWSVTQIRPGWHQWSTPTGRSYIQEPWSYMA
jgi:hypothetical protein